MTDISKDKELIARARANEVDPDAEKARLKQAVGPENADKVDAVYANIAKVRERFEISQKRGKMAKDELPMPVWTPKVALEGSPAGYIEFEGTKTESVLMDPDLIKTKSPEEIGGMYAHELGHDVRNDKDARNQTSECAADHIAKFIGYGMATASALKPYINSFPDASQVQNQTDLAARIVALESPLYKSVPEKDLDFNHMCRPTKKTDPKSRG